MSDGRNEGGRRQATTKPAAHSVDGLAETVLEGGARVAVNLEAAQKRYEEIELIGRGGMGEVWATKDLHIGRQVAIKRLREDKSAEAEHCARFVREARVQGQLEHPAIVPVYDVITEGDLPYFSMRKVRGIDLRVVIAKLREGDPDARAAFTRRKLLDAFSRVLLAVDFAHQHGVIHRDLKPSNIMLGDFGEVYVLDWGVSKILGDADAPAPTPTTQVDLETWEGSIIGTPGYVAPEQLTPDRVKLDGRSDVFALGAILFEILTLNELLPGPTGEHRTGATLSGADVEGRVLSADVPPELLAICKKATMQLMADRYPDVRTMHRALEAYLDGDRDLELRRVAAERHAATAEGVARFALERGDATDRDRRRAFQEVSRALALDPDNAKARRILAQLLTQPPAQRPAAVDEMISKSHNDSIGSVLPASIASHVIGLLILTPLLFWMGVRSWTAFAITTGLNAVTLLYTVRCRALHERGELTPASLTTLYGLNLVWTGSLATTFGPFLLVPGLAAIHTVNLTLLGISKHRRFMIGLACMTFLIPLALQELQVLPPSYVFSGDVINIQPWLHAFPATTTPLVLSLAHIVLVLVSVVFVGRFRDTLDRAEERVALNAWQHAQLAPE